MLKIYVVWKTEYSQEWHQGHWQIKRSWWMHCLQTQTEGVEDDISSFFLGGNKHDFSFIIIQLEFVGSHPWWRSEMQSCVILLKSNICVRYPESCNWVSSAMLSCAKSFLNNIKQWCSAKDKQYGTKMDPCRTPDLSTEGDEYKPFTHTAASWGFAAAIFSTSNPLVMTSTIMQSLKLIRWKLLSNATYSFSSLASYCFDHCDGQRSKFSVPIYFCHSLLCKSNMCRTLRAGNAANKPVEILVLL